VAEDIPHLTRAEGAEGHCEEMAPCVLDRGVRLARDNLALTHAHALLDGGIQGRAIQLK
jgi:hypothetical protein